MDGARFDDLTRVLAAGTDRRRFVRGLAAGLAGALTLGGRSAGAGPSPCAVRCAGEPGAGGAQCRQTCNACAGGPASVCYDAATGAFTCENIANDLANCGGCGIVCPPTDNPRRDVVCVEGACGLCIAIEGPQCGPEAPCCPGLTCQPDAVGRLRCHA
jgi:hypothetical protein